MLYISDDTQLWRLNLLSKKSARGSFDDDDDKNLHYYYQIENKNGPWVYQDKYWHIPEAGVPGFIEEYSSDVLGADYDLIQHAFANTPVTIQGKDFHEAGQQWLRSKDGGWFTIGKYGNDKILTAKNEMSLTLEGNYKLSGLSFGRLFFRFFFVT